MELKVIILAIIQNAENALTIEKLVRAFFVKKATCKRSGNLKENGELIHFVKVDLKNLFCLVHENTLQWNSLKDAFPDVLFLI